MFKKYLFFGFIGLIAMGIVSCGEREDTKKVSLEERLVTDESKITQGRPLRFAIGAGSMVIPKQGFNHYRQLLIYIAKKLGRNAEVTYIRDCSEVNELLKTGDVDIGTVCAYPYIDGHSQFGIKLLVVPQAYGESTYSCYIIASRAGSINRFEDLRGKTFAFVDPLSTIGKAVPTYMLIKMGENPDSFFQKYIYTYSHDKSIKAVAQGIVDGAAVDSVVWAHAMNTNPEIASGTKVIMKSESYGMPPVVVAPDLDPEFNERLRETFLNIHKDKKAKEFLKGMGADKFVVIDDRAYDSSRKMKAWLDEQKAEQSEGK